MANLRNMSAMAGLSRPVAMTWWYMYWMMAASSSDRALLRALMTSSLVAIEHLLNNISLGPQPAHHSPQILSDLLYGVLGVLPLERGVDGAAGLVLEEPLPGEDALLDLRQDLLHGLPHVIVDDPGPPGVVAILGGIRHRVAHIA